MADDQLDILIRTQADTAGAKDLQRELDRVKAASVKANADMGQAAQTASVKQSELKKIIHGVALEFPLLGRLAALAMNPLVAGTALAIAGIGKLAGAIAKLDEAVDV